MPAGIDAADGRDVGRPDEYEPPKLRELGSVQQLTLNHRGCFWGKKWGGTDGFEFMGIAVPVSSC